MRFRDDAEWNERIDTKPLPQGGDLTVEKSIGVIGEESYRILAACLSGNKAASFLESMLEYQLANGDYVAAACHAGGRATNQDRVMIDIESNAVCVADGHGERGDDVALSLCVSLMEEDTDGQIERTIANLRKMTRLFSKAGTCFLHAKIVDTENGKYLETRQAGDVHAMVLDETGTIVWESIDENVVTELVSLNLCTPDQSLYLFPQERATVTNSIAADTDVRSVTKNKPVALKPGYRVIIGSDGIFDNLTGDELATEETRGLNRTEMLGWIQDVVITRMQQADAIIKGTGNRAEREAYIDRLKSMPKKDNIAVVIVDIA